MAPALTEYLLLSSPLVPGIRTSAIKQDVLGWQLDSRNHRRAGTASRCPADHAGLLTGDILLAVDGAAITGADDLVRLLDAEKWIAQFRLTFCAARISAGSGRPCAKENNLHYPAAPPVKNSCKTVALLRRLSLAANNNVSVLLFEAMSCSSTTAGLCFSSVI